MPQNVWELPPAVAPHRSRRPLRGRAAAHRAGRPPPALRHAQAGRRVVDRGSLFEIQPTFGKAVITGLARMNGKVVGIVANNPMIYGGAMDVKAARKQTHFIELCDCFHIPLVFFVDVPGFMVGKDAEEAGHPARRHARRLRRAAGERADVHRGRSASATAWPAWARPTRTASTSRSPGRRRNGARCRSKAASRPRSAARSPPRPIPRRASARSRRSCARSPRRSARPRRSASRTSSIRARRGPICAASSMRRRAACAPISVQSRSTACGP